MAPDEYTLTTTRPARSSTNPVDWRKPRSGSTNAPVAADTARASALCPTGKVSPCLATSSVEVGPSSTDKATTIASSLFRLSVARSKARSWALRYGHQLPRYQSTTP